LSKDYRIRFDDEFDSLLDVLRQTGFFSENSEIVIFAGAFGLSKNHKFQRVKGSRDVRVNVLLGSPGGVEFTYLVGMQIPESESTDPLSEAALEKRIELIELFVNGGLHALNAMLKEGRSVSLAISELLSSSFDYLLATRGESFK
jgi:hypothetical protein